MGCLLAEIDSSIVVISRTDIFKFLFFQDKGRSSLALSMTYIFVRRKSCLNHEQKCKILYLLQCGSEGG